MANLVHALLVLSYVSLVVNFIAFWYLIFAKEIEYIRANMLFVFCILTVLRLLTIVVATQVLGVHL